MCYVVYSTRYTSCVAELKWRGYINYLHTICNNNWLEQEVRDSLFGDEDEHIFLHRNSKHEITMKHSCNSGPHLTPLIIVDYTML